MSSTSSSSSDGSVIPPRHRPTLAEFAKNNSGESDLWDLEEESSAGGGRVEIASEPRRQAVPEPRIAAKSKDQEDSAPAVPAQNFVKISAKQSQSAKPNPTQLAPRPGQGLDLDDLEDWVDSPLVPVLAPEESQALAPEEPQAIPAVTAVPPAEVADEKEAPSATEEEAPPVVEKPVVPLSQLLALNLSPVERIGIIALLALLLIGGGVLIFKTFGRLPTEALRVEADNFPVQGKRIKILSADSYWHVPVSEGANAEIVRRGTALIPVLKFAASGGPAGIRIVFRDSDGKVVGDVVTRTVKGGGDMEVAATAGFDEVGMHAAYRTGQSKPWTIQLYEAASANSPSKEFEKLFEMKISTARR